LGVFGAEAAAFIIIIIIILLGEGLVSGGEA
jgi:hypothetical protein